jgi:predicted short-subunit dehydrogenase-like oxidoreductase (DUF2520 family)
MRCSFAIVGAGKVGRALARLLTGEGYDFIGAASRSRESAESACEFAGAGEPFSDPAALTARAELVLLTVPDDAIEDVCSDIAERDGFRQGSVVAHCSGALPSTILSGAREAGASAGSLHPLQSFATAEQVLKILPGSYCCIEGDSGAVEVLQGVARAADCNPMTIPTEGKTLYHAAAVIACNFLVALEDAAVEVDGEAGIDEDQALQSLMPLIRGTVDNLADVGLPDCLTGPIARGDVRTTEEHLRELERACPDLLPLYRTLAVRTVKVGREKGTLGEEKAEELLRLVNGHTRSNS